MDITAAVNELPVMHRKRLCVFSMHPDEDHLHLLIYRRQNTPLMKVF